MAEPNVIEVRAPGALTTVQDLGRPGQGRFGVSTGGALDRASLILGNRLLGNDDGAAAIEATLTGPTLVFGRETVIAMTGAELGARLNGGAVPLWTPLAMRAGEELRFEPPANAIGARGYVCVAGGIAVDPVLGARATDLIGGFGGYRGRALRAGDRLPIGESALDRETLVRRRLSTTPAAMEAGTPIRVVAGPQWDRFTEAGRAQFLSGAYRVSPRSNRQGLRMIGPAIELARGADLVSEGIAHGAIQVPGDGLPIVLLGARQTVGGYVKIATVIGADLDRLGQVRPGDEIRFAEVPVTDAQAAWRERAEWLASIEAITDDRGFAGAALGIREIEAVAGGWDPDGVIRVLETLERIGASSFSIEVQSAGLKLDLQRDGSSSVAHQTETESTAQSRATTVTAPVLGVFFRKSAPDQPELAAEGSEVREGQAIGVIEVMKTYHEITAPRAGLLTRFLIEDGQFVEYGQPVAELA